MKHVPTVRERDKDTILAAVRRFHPISRVGIHHLTRIRPATISLLVRELLREGMLKIAGHANNPTGRKQVLLEINEKSGCVIAVDFDEEFLDAALLDLHPRTVFQFREATMLSAGIDGLIGQIVGSIQKVIERSGKDREKIRGIGVGVPGLVNSREGSIIMSSTIEFWRNIKLKEILEKQFAITTLIENNSRTKASAECILGADELADEMIYVEYGKGIGSGIILHGKVLHGQRFSAGELGHTHILENGPACRCGSLGCLEAIAGVNALEAQLRKFVAEGGTSRCLEMAEGDLQRIDGWMVLKAARLGDKLSLAIVEDLAKHLGLALANLVNLFNPSVIVLDHRLEAAGPQFLDSIRRLVCMQALSHATENLNFRFGKLGSEVGILGAALLVTETVFEIPMLKPPRFIIEGVTPASARAMFDEVTKAALADSSPAAIH
jgi:predicted NBD/HSP70 family sugar kinase